MAATVHTDRRLTVLVSLVVFLGIVVVAASGVVALLGAAPSPWAVGALVLLVGVGDQLHVIVRIRSSQVGIAWVDVAVLTGMAVMSPEWVVLASVVGATVSKVIRRVRPSRLAFGVAKEAVTASIGGLVLSAFGVAGSVTGPADLLPVALAFTAMTVVDDLLFFPVIAASTGTRAIDRYRENLDIRLFAVVIRMVVTLLAVMSIWMQPRMLYGLPVLVLLAHLWHERWVRTREERRAWQRLAIATETFNAVDMDVVLEAAVTQGAALFSADELEVELWHTDQPRLVRGGATVTYDGPPEKAPADTMSVYAVALHGYPGSRDIGALRLRFRGKVTMSAREQAMLSSYAAALETAVRNATAYGQLGAATAAHARAAAQDPLTGLANRRELERQLHTALSRRTGPECRLALLLVDLRHFKEVNDTLGHLVGDRVLVEIGKRLADSVRPVDLVTRFGGDEFVVLLRDAYHPAEVEAHAREILQRLVEPVIVDDLRLVVEANAGLALAVDPPGDPDSGPAGAATPTGPVSTFQGDPAAWMAELLRRADVAVYQAKRARRPLVFYRPSDDPADRDRLALAGELPVAVAQRQFTLHFQPVVELATGVVRGAEGLARWRHPERGQLEPRWFLDLLERSTQLGEFTAAVLHEALDAAELWSAAGFDLSVSVNVSARSLLDVGLPRMVAQALDAHPSVAPSRLCLELTETLAISQLDTVDRVLRELRALGVRLALDDFGTGYSSLAALSRIPVQQLKIDRSFVDAVSHPWTSGSQAAGVPPERSVDQATAVIRSTVQLGRALDLAVVAEGVENHTQRELLWQLGCTLGQGHLFSRPISATALAGVLRRGVDGTPGTLASPLRSSGSVIHIPRPRTGEDGTGREDAGSDGRWSEGPGLHRGTGG